MIEAEPRVHQPDELAAPALRREHDLRRQIGNRRLGGAPRALEAQALVDEAVRAMEDPDAPGDDVVQLVFPIERRQVERPAELLVQPEHHVGQVRVAEEHEDQARLDPARNYPVLEGEIPERRPGPGLQQRRHRRVRELPQPPLVEARPGHRVADDDVTGLHVAEIGHASLVESRPFARALEGREIGRRKRTIAAGAKGERDAEWHRERDQQQRRQADDRADRRRRRRGVYEHGLRLPPETCTMWRILPV
jgi:hypothetical protein